MVIDNKILDDLSAQAKANPRLRQAMDLRNSPEDLSQRMLNALEPGTVMPIHRHMASSETVTLLRGKIRWHFYDDAGKETGSVLLDANGDVRCINVGKARWHSDRLKEHQGDASALFRGARFTKAHLPVKLVYTEEYEDEHQARMREQQLHGWTRAKKEALISGDIEKLKQLSKKKDLS